MNPSSLIIQMSPANSSDSNKSSYYPTNVIIKWILKL
jgi:hypothetical protein